MDKPQLLSLESEAGFKALFDYAKVGILVVSADGNIQLANPAMENMFGYSGAELIGQPIEILVPESFRKKHVDLRSSYFESPSARSMGLGLNVFAKKKNGIQFPVEISLGYYELDSEILAVAFITDDTVRAASEERYRNLFDNSLVAMFITDLVTQDVIDVNEMGANLFGFKSKKDFLKDFKPSFHFVNASERKKYLLELRNSPLDHFTREQQMRKLDGSIFWCKVFAKVNREKSTVQKIVLDISEIKHTHEELDAAVQERTFELTESLSREKELSELKSRLVSMASHEFRTPLSSILTSLSLVDRYNGPEHADKRKKHIERIKSSVSHLVSILDDFLSLDKLERGKVEVVKEVFDIHTFSIDVIEEVNGMLKPGQRINFGHQGDRQIMLDKKILKNVLLNLLSNAIKYSGEHKGIDFVTQVGRNSITILVRDEGIGIPPEDQIHLFNKYFRAKNASNIQGTGLGLNIVKKYIELLNGSIDFSSSCDVGTTFTVEIPFLAS